jgi:hypothetical protein
VLGDLAVAHAHDVDGLELNFATRRRHPQNIAPDGEMADWMVFRSDDDDPDLEILLLVCTSGDQTCHASKLDFARRTTAACDWRQGSLPQSARRPRRQPPAVQACSCCGFRACARRSSVLTPRHSHLEHERQPAPDLKLGPNLDRLLGGRRYCNGSRCFIRQGGPGSSLSGWVLLHRVLVDPDEVGVGIAGKGARGVSQRHLRYLGGRWAAPTAARGSGGALHRRGAPCARVSQPARAKSSSDRTLSGSALPLAGVTVTGRGFSKGKAALAASFRARGSTRGSL